MWLRDTAGPMARPDQTQPSRSPRFTLIMATDALRRFDRFAIAKDFALGPASNAVAARWQCTAPRGGGW